MSDVINGIFGYAKNDTSHSGGYVEASTAFHSDVADVAVIRETGETRETRETVDTEAIEADQFETVNDVAADADLVVEPVAEETEVAEETAVAEDTAVAEVAEEAESSTETVSAAETVEPDSVAVSAEDDEIAEDVATDVAADEATDEIADDASDEVVADEDAAEDADEDAGITAEAESADVESADVESDETPVVAAAETDAESEESIEQVEPVVEAVTAEARPAAGTRGSITVDDAVVVKVVNMMARKVEGVHGLGDEGISVEVDGDVATIEISLVVEFGHAVKALAEQTRITVIEAVEEFLGLDVASVDIHVSDIHLPDAA